MSWKVRVSTCPPHFPGHRWQRQLVSDSARSGERARSREFFPSLPCNWISRRDQLRNIMRSHPRSALTPLSTRSGLWFQESREEGESGEVSSRPTRSRSAKEVTASQGRSRRPLKRFLWAPGLLLRRRVSRRPRGKSLPRSGAPPSPRELLSRQKQQHVNRLTEPGMRLLSIERHACNESCSPCWLRGSK